VDQKLRGGKRCENNAKLMQKKRVETLTEAQEEGYEGGQEDHTGRTRISGQGKITFSEKKPNNGKGDNSSGAEDSLKGTRAGGNGEEGLRARGSRTPKITSAFNSPFGIKEKKGISLKRKKKKSIEKRTH